MNFRRFLAFAVDITIIIAIVYYSYNDYLNVLGSVTAKFLISFIVTPLAYFFFNEGSTENIALFLLLGTFLIYYSLMEGVFNATIGKFITGIRVQTIKKSSFWDRLFLFTARTFLKLTPFNLYTYRKGDFWNNRITDCQIVFANKRLNSERSTEDITAVAGNITTVTSEIANSQ